MSQPFWSFIVRALLLAGIVTAPVNAVAVDRPEARQEEQVDAAALTQQIGELRDQGEYAKAIEAGRAAVALTEKTFGRDNPRTGDAKRALAAAYLEVDDKVAAAPLLRDAIAILERADPPDEVALSYAVGDLAQAVENDSEAESLYRRALTLAEKSSGPEHAATGHALNNLGRFLFKEDRTREAEPFMRRALRVRERTNGVAGPLTAQSLCTLGNIAAALGDISVAESLVRRSLELRRAVLPKSHPDLAESCFQLARILLAQGKERAEEASALATEAGNIYRSGFGPDSMQTLVAMHLKADALATLGRQTESERLHQELIAKIESLPGSDQAVLSEALGDFGEHMLQAGKPDKAVELYRRAVSLQRKARGDDDPTVVAMRQRLAEALYASMQVEDAVKEARAVVATLERAGGDPPPALGIALYSLAKYLLGTGGMEEARPLLRKSIAIFDKTTGRGSQETLRAIYLLAMTYTVTDEFEEAERLVDDGLGRVVTQDVRTISVAGDLIGLRAVIYRKTGRLKEAAEAEAVAKQIEADERRR